MAQKKKSSYTSSPIENARKRAIAWDDYPDYDISNVQFIPACREPWQQPYDSPTDAAAWCDDHCGQNCIIRIFVKLPEEVLRNPEKYSNPTALIKFPYIRRW